MKLEEDTKMYQGHCEIRSSNFMKGMVLVEIWMKDRWDDSSSAGIRLTRNQAREMAQELNRLADDLFFQEQRGE